MEPTTEFVIPTITPKPELLLETGGDNTPSKSKKTKDKDKLARINRQVRCIHCDSIRILNPDQYEAYFAYWGNEDKINRNFVCQPCDSAKKENPFKFWLKYSEQTKKLLKTLRATFELYKSSTRGAAEQTALYTMINNALGEYRLYNGTDFPINCQLINSNMLPIGITIYTFPFVDKTVELRPYEVDDKVQFV